MWTRERIIAEIQRTASENGGQPLSENAFRESMGLARRQWRGKYWTRWSEAQAEAGLEPTVFLTRVFSDGDLRRLCALLSRELGEFPREVDLSLARQADPSFPGVATFTTRLGRTKRDRAAAVREYAIAVGSLDDVVAICDRELSSSGADADSTLPDGAEIGFVYLFKSGDFYKIGRSNSTGRREYEVALQMPEPVRTVHRINTDDPVGIEAYWHKRFAAKRKKGEWFDLDSADVAAFRLRKFQ